MRISTPLNPKGSSGPANVMRLVLFPLCTLGDIARLAGDLGEARRRFEQALSMSKKIGFAPAVARAEDGLLSLSETSQSR